MSRDEGHKYERLSPTAQLLPDTEYSESCSKRVRKQGTHWVLHAAIHLLLLSVSITVYHVLVSVGGLRDGSKVLSRRFNGSFDRSSPYKGPPSAAVDKAWDDILPLHVMRISEDKFATLNASKHAVRLPQEAGGGRMALFEAFHLVHCVKTLWEATYPDYYLKNDEYYRDRMEEWREHVDHCADMLRQKLMCDADSTIVTYNWLKKHTSPHPNFNVQHKCGDYDALMVQAQLDRVGTSMIPRRGKLVVGELIEFDEPPLDPNADE